MSTLVQLEAINLLARLSRERADYVSKQQQSSSKEEREAYGEHVTTLTQLLAQVQT